MTGESTPGTGRLDAQLEFLLEADRLKQVLRRTTLPSGGRLENSAEHSWHLALFAAVLAEHAAEPVELDRVIRMLLVHDLVEIDAGDTFAYDRAGQRDKVKREQRAADRLFGMLPPDQAAAFRALWDEFEARETADARFAAAVDRLQPVMLNRASAGVAWRRHGVSSDQVLAYNAHIEDGSPALWAAARRLIEEAVASGLLHPGELYGRAMATGTRLAELRARLRDVILTYGHERRDEPFELASGRTSHDFVDGKRALARGDDLRIACEALIEAAREAGVEFDAVGGMTMGADQFAHGVALMAGKQWFVVRKEPKGRGTNRVIEGALIGPTTRVLLVEDVVTTGGSVRAALEQVREAGAPVVAVAALLDRGDAASALFGGEEVPYLPLLSYADLGIEPVS